MKSVLQQSLRTALAVLLLAGAWELADLGDAVFGLPRHLLGGALLVAGVAALFAVLFRRVRSEDRIAHLEAELCREQNARSQADQALAEADLLLTRLTARSSGNLFARRVSDPDIQLGAHLAQIQAELAQIQMHTPLDPSSAGRLSRARDRLEQVARVVRNATRAAELGQPEPGPAESGLAGRRARLSQLAQDQWRELSPAHNRFLSAINCLTDRPKDGT